MSTETLDRLQEDKLGCLEKFLDSSNGLDLNEQAGALADFIVDEAIGVRQGLLRLWDYHWSMALAGEIADRSGDGAKLRSLLERGALVIARSAKLARVYAQSAGLEVARLGQLEAQSETFPNWIKECMARWDLPGRPLKPLNRENVAKARAAFAQGACEDAAAILSRLSGSQSTDME